MRLKLRIGHKEVKKYLAYISAHAEKMQENVILVP